MRVGERSPRHRLSANEMGKELGIDVSLVETVGSMKNRIDILVTTTPSCKPLVFAESMTPGLHVNTIGADDPPKIALDADALKKADKIVIAAEDSLLSGQFAIQSRRESSGESKSTEG